MCLDVEMRAFRARLGQNCGRKRSQECRRKESKEMQEQVEERKKAKREEEKEGARAKQAQPRRYEAALRVGAEHSFITSRTKGFPARHA